MASDNVVKFEAKHVFYTESRNDDKSDACFIKEIQHHPDGTTTSNLRMLKNFKRDWYLTNRKYRNHTDKKESEVISKLDKFTTNTRMMPNLICRQLGLRPSNNMRHIARSQYVYGTDIRPETLIKQKYMRTWKDIVSPSSVAVVDLETNMGEGRRDHLGFGDIISASFTMKDKAYLIYTKDFIGNIDNPDDKLQKAFTKYLGKYQKERNITLTTIQVKDDVSVIIELLKIAHEIGPDFIAVWNINFDLPKMIRTLQREGLDPARYFSDPSVPPEFRDAYYHEGPANRVTASGKMQNFAIHERWHWFNAPAKFYWVDAMCTYAFIRKAKGQEKSYSLDYILNKVLGERKLNFTFADHLTKADWHIFMQAKFKIEYLIYNIFDCIGVELLDEKTSDLSLTLPELCGSSPFSSFSSTPKQLADDLHFFFLSERRVICSTSDKMRTELDDKVVTMDDWIITLATHLVEENGLRCIKDHNELLTLIRMYVSDLDIRSAYPWGEIVCNVSKATTVKELCRIQGVTEKDKRRIGLNLTGGTTNAVAYTRIAHKAPTLDALVEACEVKYADELKQAA